MATNKTKSSGSNAMPAHKTNAFGGKLSPLPKETPAPSNAAGKEG